MSRAVLRRKVGRSLTAVGESTLYRNRLLSFHSGVWFSVCVWLVLRCWFCLVAVCFVFFCCLILPGGIVALRKKLQWLLMVKQ